MSVPAMESGSRAVAREDDTRRRVGSDDGARFDAAMRKRQRARPGRTDDDDPPLQTVVDPPPLWMTLAAGLGKACDSVQGIRRGGMADTAEAPTPRDSLFPAGAEVGTASSGRALHLRFTQGQWAGVELQAALHAGEVVVTLRPLNRQQHRRLCEARSSLCEQVADETGQKVRLEIVDATR